MQFEFGRKGYSKGCVQECRDYYKSICETRSIYKKVTEAKISRKTIQN